MHQNFNQMIRLPVYKLEYYGKLVTGMECESTLYLSFYYVNGQPTNHVDCYYIGAMWKTKKQGPNRVDLMTP